MASLTRREYKKKAADSALDEATEIVSDLDNWRDAWPTLIEKINSTRIELRVSALQSMNKILTARYLGYEDLQPYLDDTVNCLHGPIMDRASRAEHDEALGVLCNLAMNTFAEFEPFLRVFLNDIMPTLSDMHEEESFRFFAIAFAVSLSVSHQDLCLNVIKKLISLMMNKKSRTTDFTPEMLAECLKAICLLAATFEDQVVAETLLADLQGLLDLAISNHKPLVILAALDLVPIIYEAIVTNEIQNPTENGVSVVASKQFAAKYKTKLASLGQDLPKKADQKAVFQKTQEINNIFDGETVEEELTLNNQNVTISGVRPVYILQAIRRVTRVHFQNQMSENLDVQNLFGYQLLSTQHALRLKKKHKSEIQRDRVVSKKEREMAIEKKRRQKDGL
ncbi:hypothetical protein TRFO_34883 [Tritrichomonas foetus]|uniref:Interferon-related developmental regulator N-terminal domain-containing protein n=1 Tax=Tritrichomonas foetus TaxID=1144522 RepID=A0A1J4JHN8_9EUKA|nr:hypothetical protein TRFO_34883 [Tritrichomonas foetus]|eukprot:OHS98664.1 hypothetical protein TRFO_34883 [Tritrichomonas foetus]